MRLLTPNEFHALYDGEKPYYEYWFGEAIQKSTPTWLHSVLQRLMVELLEQSGYYAGQEVELRVASDWTPVPDVVGVTVIEQPYPTHPVPVVVEVLSPGDKWPKIEEKCLHYAEIGTEAVFVLDPEALSAYAWNKRQGHLEKIEEMHLPNGQVVALTAVWRELQRRASLSTSPD